MDCGGFHFLAENGRVTHPTSKMYQRAWGEYPNIVFKPCVNSGKTFIFPEQGPTLAIEVTE